MKNSTPLPALEIMMKKRSKKQRAAKRPRIFSVPAVERHALQVLEDLCVAESRAKWLISRAHWTWSQLDFKNVAEFRRHWAKEMRTWQRARRQAQRDIQHLDRTDAFRMPSGDTVAGKRLRNDRLDH